MNRRSWPMLLLLAALVVACSGGEPPVEETPTSYSVRGMFARVEDDGMTMTVRHEEIPDYMATMTMPFKVADATLLEGLEYGDKISFELDVYSDHSVVTAIETLPADTVLAFETE